MRNIITLLLFIFCFSAKAQVTATYIYDNLNRLTTASYSNGVGLQYTYDKLGNRTQESKTSTLSVVDATPTKSFTLYPNPFKDELFITSDNQTITEVSIIDVSGKVIKKISNLKTKSYRLEANGLPQGNYLVSIKTDVVVEIYKVIKK